MPQATVIRILPLDPSGISGGTAFQVVLALLAVVLNRPPFMVGKETEYSEVISIKKTQ